MEWLTVQAGRSLTRRGRFRLDLIERHIAPGNDQNGDKETDKKYLPLHSHLPDMYRYYLPHKIENKHYRLTTGGIQPSIFGGEIIGREKSDYRVKKPTNFRKIFEFLRGWKYSSFLLQKDWRPWVYPARPDLKLPRGQWLFSRPVVPARTPCPRKIRVPDLHHQE